MDRDQDQELALALAAHREQLERSGQAHLLRFWDELDQAERAELLGDLSGCHFPEIMSFFNRAVSAPVPIQQQMDEQMEPVPREVQGSVSRDWERLPEWKAE
eukprot:g20127.t1